MKAKKPAKHKKEVILKSDKSFDELIEDAFNDKPLKKGEMKTIALVAYPGPAKKKAKKAVKKAAKKKKKK